MIERRHFGSGRGYLNIDEHGLYLSASGNWQEAHATPERSVKGRAKRSVYGLFGILLVLARGGLGFAHVDTARANGLVLALGFAGAGVLLAMHRFRHDLAPHLRIPFTKVRALACGKDRIDVHFVNGDDREDHLTIQAPPAAVELARQAFSASRGERVR